MATLTLPTGTPRTLRLAFKDLAFHHTAARQTRTAMLQTRFFRGSYFARNTWVSDDTYGGGFIINPRFDYTPEEPQAARKPLSGKAVVIPGYPEDEFVEPTAFEADEIAPLPSVYSVTHAYMRARVNVLLAKDNCAHWDYGALPNGIGEPCCLAVLSARNAYRKAKRAWITATTVEG